MLLDAILNTVGAVLDKVIPDVNARAQAKEELSRAVLQDDFQLALAQIQTNQAEAQSDNIFKSGWRPGIGWICGIAFSLHFVIFPILNWFLILFHQTAITIPFDMNTLMTVLGGLLGIGGLRTIEKIKGVA
jgi:Holin of 3TMs, for gene-transfer release